MKMINLKTGLIAISFFAISSSFAQTTTTTSDTAAVTPGSSITGTTSGITESVDTSKMASGSMSSMSSDKADKKMMKSDKKEKKAMKKMMPSGEPMKSDSAR